MGRHMAANLVRAGFAVHGVDINEKNLKMADEMGIKPFDKINQACEGLTGNDFVITSLPDTSDVEKTMVTKGGILESVADKEGCMIIDTSTVSPIASQQFHKVAKETNCRFLDAPVAGGVPGAKNGSLVFMVGAGSEEDFEYS